MPEVTRIVPIGHQAIKKIRVAAYCRVSTNSADQLNSYATQIRVYTTMIQRKPEWELVEVFADEGISGTARVLNDEGILSKEKRQWTKCCVKYVLRNEKYVGDTLCQKTYSLPVIPFRQKRNYGEMDCYYISNTHQGIVSKNVYESVQQLFDKRKKKHDARITTNQYPLTSRIQCLECGSFYRRRIVNGCISWGCSKHIADRTQCDSQYYREERIYDAYVGLVNKLRFSDEDMLAESIRLLDLAIAMKKRKSIQAQEASETLAELNTKLLMLEKLRRKGYLAPEIYEGQAKTIRNQIHEIKQQKAEASKSKLEEVQAEIGELRKKLSQYEDPLERFDENLFKETVKSVTIDKNRRITFTLLGDLTFTETL